MGDAVNCTPCSPKGLSSWVTGTTSHPGLSSLALQEDCPTGREESLSQQGLAPPAKSVPYVMFPSSFAIAQVIVSIFIWRI